MAATLRVDPERLRAAAAAQADVGTYVSGMHAGRSVADAVSAMPGLFSGEACRAVAALLDGAATAAGADLTEHAQRLSRAADNYHQTDSEAGRRLGRIVE